MSEHRLTIEVRNAGIDGLLALCSCGKYKESSYNNEDHYKSLQYQHETHVRRSSETASSPMCCACKGLIDLTKLDYDYWPYLHHRGCVGFSGF